MAYWVYILECGDGTFYTGTAADVDRRLAVHQSGRGAKYTRAGGRCGWSTGRSAPTRGPPSAGSTPSSS